MWSIFRDYTLGNLVVITRLQNMVMYEYVTLRIKKFWTLLWYQTFYILKKGIIWQYFLCLQICKSDA